MSKKKSFFGIEITHKKPQSLKLQYILGIREVGQLPSSTILEMDRKRFFINGKEPLRSFDQLAERCFKSMGPIQIEVTSDNKIVSSPNLKEIRMRWEKELKLLEMEFKGAVVEGYFQQISNNLGNEEYFLKSLENDIGCSLLVTRPISAFSAVALEDKIKFRFPINAYGQKSVFYGTRSFKSDHNGNRINCFSGTDDYNGTLDLNYQFKQDSSVIMKIKGNFTSEDSEKEIDYRATYLKNRKA